ncbi:MAG: hypothetical protein IPM34_06625 [Saprospiraceae bacterium]|nr:hypothetical protein [Saprospiraceae bacterium]
MNTVVIQVLIFIYNTMIPGGMPPPPGTFSLNDSLFIDKTLVSIEDYSEFLYSIKAFNFKEIDINKCFPDSNIYYKGTRYLETKDYKRVWPILNLTENQMQAYCKWRSWAVTYWKNNPSARSCSHPYWEALDTLDSGHQLVVEYSLPDSLLLSSIKLVNKNFIPERGQDINSKTRKRS